ncbi:MAG: exo 1,3/1,4-beta-D-glucan glucohydrolase [Arenimonas sp.]|nr:exo 1,3/1,4-beta-D-glucan glucohydrolase [Arenimonas sp.]
MKTTTSISLSARRRPLKARCALLLVSMACCLHAAEARPDMTGAAGNAGQAGATAHPELWPALSSPIPVDKALEARIRALLDTMTIEEKVGQIVQGDLGSLTPEDVRRYRLGSVLGGGNSDPGARYNAKPAEWLALADALHLASMDTSAGGKAIPVILGIDAVHGHNNVVGATLFPHNIALGAANDPELVRKIAQATAVELRVTGFEWTFAPTLTVPRDDRWGRTYEGYSEDPGLVARYAPAVVEGLQGKVGSAGFLDATRVASSAKHFVGDGGTEGGKDTGDTRVSEEQLRDIHGAGYAPALQAGTQTVMASFSSWNGQKMHGNKSLLTDVLKGRMGFDGFVVGDWNAQGKVPGCSNESCPAAVLAGVDMIMAPDTWRGFYTNTVAQVRSGEIPMKRLDDAVTRILRVKFRLGLFEAGLPSKRLLGGKFDQLGSAEHRELARSAVRQSLVLLKNNDRLLPLNPGANVLVAGDGADDIGKQSGGWTLSWQGTGNKREDFPGAQSIWEGIKAASIAGGGKATLSIDGKHDSRPDVAIVVFGEDPYAETPGDRPNLAYNPGNDKDLELLRRLKGEGIPVVAVFLSGRPLSVNREINAADAFVAAWLPGSEGGGVADVLFKSPTGETVFDFSGRLSFSWPRRATQSPLNFGQAGYDPQFALGHGLSYKDAGQLGPLPEDSALPQWSTEPGVFFARGILAPGWTLEFADGEQTGIPVGNLPSATPSLGAGVSATDHEAQEDARRFAWRGSEVSRVWLHSEAPLDLRPESNGDLSLVATVRVDTMPSAAVDIGIACGQGCVGRVPAQAFLKTLSPGRWTRVAVPLKCFARAGADLARVTDLFELRAASPFELSVSRVALGTEYDQALSCQAP